jgi:hypothetical protein
MTQAEVARVTTVVAVDPAAAFEVFTAEIGSWWKSGPRYRFDPEKNGTMRFEAEGAGTRLTVEHRGWESIRPGHPARHGFTGPAFADMMGLWWADLLVSIRHTARLP